MPVLGLNIDGIKAERKEEFKGGVKVNSNTNIKDVKEQPLPGTDKKALVVDFEFITKYTDSNEKEIANFLISGDVLVVDNKQKEIMEAWKKDKQLPEDTSIEVINVIFNKCSKKAIILSDDLQLPSPVPLPFAKKKQN